MTWKPAKNHPFNLKNQLLHGDIMVELDQQNIYCNVPRDTTCDMNNDVDGDRSAQQQILELRGK